MTVLLTFAHIGSTAFGGGSATIAAMRKACLRHGWLDDPGFVDVLVVSRLSPGISIFAQALLIGRAACGAAGMIASVTGLVLPSVAATVILAWAYGKISALPEAHMPLHAIAAIAAGFAVALTLQLLRAVLKRSRLWRGVLAFVMYATLALLLSRPLLVMAIAIALALVWPGLFDLDATAPSAPAQRPRHDTDRER